MRVEGVGSIQGSSAAPDKGTTGPLHVQELVWLAAEVCGITPLQALTIQSKPGPLARNMVAMWLHDFEGIGWRQIANLLGRHETTITANYSNFKRKLRGPNGLDEIYGVFMRRAAKLPRMQVAAPGRGGSFLQSVDPSRTAEGS